MLCALLPLLRTLDDVSDAFKEEPYYVPASQIL
jgi:hypothetical protein